MKKNINRYITTILSITIGIFIISQTWSCKTTMLSTSYPTDTVFTNIEGMGWPIELVFRRGASHNHPLMAVWTTDTNNTYIETLFIAESIGKGYFDRVDKSTGKWLPGPIRRPASLPVWAYSRNIMEEDSLYIPTSNTPMPDAVTGATPRNNFVLVTKTSSKNLKVFDLYFEINQTWDWNEYWTNNKYPNDSEYKTSCQPALVYMARIDIDKGTTRKLELIGRSEYNGSNGNIYNDLETITTAKNIAESIVIKY